MATCWRRSISRASGCAPGTLVKIIGTSTCDCIAVPLSQDLPDIPGVCGIVPESILPGHHGIEAGQSAVGDIFNWFVSRVLGHSGDQAAKAHADLTQQAARALAKHGVRVNAICPGIVDTDFNWRLDDLLGVRQQGLAPGEFMKQRAASVPLGRLAEPDDIARVIVFLASPAGGYITGQAVTVDGGFLMH